MRRAISMCLLFLTIAGAPAHAQLTATIAAAQLAEQKTFDAFMSLQIVQEILLLRQTYNASVDYFQQMKQMNSGKGLLYNVGQELKTAENQETKQLSQQFMTAWNARGTAPVKKMVEAVDQAIASNVKYAGDEMANVIANRKTGVNLAQNANGLSPKDAANLTAKSQGLQLQAMTQLHEDNLHLIQLLSLQLSGQTRPEEGQQKMIEGMRQSVQAHYPGAQPDTEAAQ